MITKNSTYKYLLAASLLLTLSVFTGCSTIGSRAGSDGINRKPENMEYLGSISAEMLNWNWFFQPSEGKRVETLRALARKRAEEMFGEDIILETESVEGQWNPLSLLMLLNTLGYAEDAAIEVSVWKEKQPVPLAAAEAPKEYGIRYRVIPEQDYMQPAGFVTVEYKTRAELAAELTEALESERISAGVFEKRKKLLPGTGRVFITLGRAEISNAITRWFTFSCTYNGKLLFHKKGTEDIPYVYGTDRLWWNDKSYDIDTEWDGELEVAVEDGYQEKVYNFKIVKERYLIE